MSGKNSESIQNTAGGPFISTRAVTSPFHGVVIFPPGKQMAREKVVNQVGYSYHSILKNPLDTHIKTQKPTHISIHTGTAAAKHNHFRSHSSYDSHGWLILWTQRKKSRTGKELAFLAHYFTTLYTFSGQHWILNEPKKLLRLPIITIPFPFPLFLFLLMQARTDTLIWHIKAHATVNQRRRFLRFLDKLSMFILLLTTFPPPPQKALPRKSHEIPPPKMWTSRFSSSARFRWRRSSAAHCFLHIVLSQGGVGGGGERNSPRRL